MKVFLPAYLEETNYCVRARMAGYRVVCSMRTTIIYYVGVTISKRLSKLRINYVWHKNRIRFMLLNFPLRWWLRRTKYELKVVISVLFEKKDEARRLSLLNAKLCEDWHRGLVVLLRAYLTNIRVLSEIVQKRMYRTSKVWY
jgi:GT2 family glycosyltransferase